MMIKSTTLLLALGGIAAGAALRDSVEGGVSSEDLAWDYQVVGEPRAADADDRGLLSGYNECITIRMNGDANSPDNSVTLLDLDTGDTIYEKNDYARNVQEDSSTQRGDCITAPVGHILKFTVNTPSGYSSSDYFHALFVGQMRLFRMAGSEKNVVDTECFKLVDSSPHYQTLTCPTASSTSITTTSGPPPSSPVVSSVPFSSRMGCGDGQRKVKIVFEKDQWNENYFFVRERSQGSRNGLAPHASTPWKSGNTVWTCDKVSGQSYCNSQTIERCLDAGDYEFVMQDGNKDGCPKLELHMENSKGQWEALITKCYMAFGGQWTRAFTTRSKPSLTIRQQKWLDTHNDRRLKYWYEGGKMRSGTNPHYVPQRWDSELARQAQVWADAQLDDCGTDTMAHDPNRNGAGENMAKNRGGLGSEYGQMYEPTNVMNRFVEMELNKDYGKRYHLTQVLWKASVYVGCADGFKEYQENGVTKQCHTQVCRYAAPGNCGVSASNDLQKMMEDPDDQTCGMRSPPNGQYAA